MIDLNSLLPANSGWILEEATAVSDAGQIVGVGLIDGQTHAFLLDTTSVPEPSSIALIIACAGLIAALRTKHLIASLRRPHLHIVG